MSEGSEVYDRCDQPRMPKNCFGTKDVTCLSREGSFRGADLDTLQLRVAGDSDLEMPLDCDSEVGNTWADAIPNKGGVWAAAVYDEKKLPRQKLRMSSDKGQAQMLRASGYGPIVLDKGRIVASVVSNGAGDVLVRDPKTGNYIPPEQV